MLKYLVILCAIFSSPLAKASAGAGAGAPIDVLPPRMTMISFRCLSRENWPGFHMHLDVHQTLRQFKIRLSEELFAFGWMDAVNPDRIAFGGRRMNEDNDDETVFNLGIMDLGRVQFFIR